MAGSELPSPVSGKATVVVFVALTLIFSAIIYYGKNVVQARLPAGPRSERSMSAAARLRGHCAVLGESVDAGPSCAANEVAWCDATGRQLACCGGGLVAAEGGAPGCAPAPSGGAELEAVMAPVDASKPRIIECYDALRKEAPGPLGDVDIHFALTPEGELFSAAVGRPNLPDRKPQACALDVLRSIRFAPPRGGFLEVRTRVSLAP